MTALDIACAGLSLTGAGITWAGVLAFRRILRDHDTGP